MTLTYETFLCIALNELGTCDSVIQERIIYGTKLCEATQKLIATGLRVG